MTGFRFLAAALISASLFSACQREPEPQALRLEQAWARTTPPGAKTGAGYLVIVNGSMPDRLLGATTTTAEKVELHESARDGMVMTMRPMEAVNLAAGETLVLAPGGKHLMFTGLKAPFAKDAVVPVTLRFEKAGERQVDLVVRSAPPEAAHGH